MATELSPVVLRSYTGRRRADPVAVFASPEAAVGAEMVAAEAAAFPEAPDIFPAAEPTFVMLGIVIDGSLHHVMRLSVSAARDDVHDTFFVRDLVRSGQGITDAGADAHFRARGADLARAVSVESNTRLGPPVGGIPTADLAYLAVFDVVVRTRATAVFAHLNEAARKSFSRVGLAWEPFLGDASLRTPGAAPGEFDDRYRPVFIPVDEANVAVFGALADLMPPVEWEPSPPGWWEPAAG